MNALLEQVNSIGKAFVEFAVPMLVQSGVLIVILLLIDLALRKKVKAVFRYCIWMLVLLKLILPTSLSSPLSLGYWFGDKLAYVAESQTSAEEVTEPEALEPALANMLYIIEPVPIEVERPAPAVLPMMPDVEPAVTEAVGPPAAPVTPVTWQGVVFLLWLAVVMALGLLLLQRAIFVRGLVAQAKEANSLMNDALEYCCKCMGVKRKVGLKVSANAASPAVCGLFRPVILLPHKLAPSLGSRGLRAVLLHELAHIRRRDLWVNLVQTVLQIMYFYNPLLWVANCVIRRVREQAIDETVLVAMGEKAQQYPQTLVNVAKLAFKRPVLSLRLIGVVESKSALAGRIKHILNRPMPRTAKLGIVSVLAVIIAGAILLPMARAEKAEFAGEGGPLDIRLAGVRPDGSDDIYDGNGNKIAENTFANIATQWGEDEQNRTFIFELPKTEEPILFTPFLQIKPTSGKHGFGTVQHPLLYYSEDKLTYSVAINFPRTYKYKKVFDRQVKKVDLTLRYYHGPRGAADFVFTGPFTAGQTFKADGGADCELTATKDRLDFSHYPAAFFRISSKTRFDSDSVLGYDTSGRRYLPEPRGGRSGSGGSERRYRAEGLTLNSIAYVTVGEKPYEAAFKNVAVSYLDQPTRDRMEFLDEMCERLDLTGLSGEQLYEYEFENPADALKVIDIVRGQWHVRKVFDAIRYGKPGIELSSLDAQTQQKVRSAAGGWAAAGHPNVRAMGIRLGLVGGWPGFMDLALEWLEQDVIVYDMVGRAYRGLEEGAKEEIAGEIANYPIALNSEQAERLKKIILRTDSPRLGMRLFQLFWRADKDLTFQTCRDLVQDDRPWIWWPAMKTVLNRCTEKLRPFENLPEKMQKRLILVHEAGGGSSRLFDVSSSGKDYETVAREAYSMLPGIFTANLARMNGSTCHDVRQVMVKHMDLELATRVMTDFLREISTEPMQWLWAGDSYYFNTCCVTVCYIVRTLNVWYDVNIGNLGTDETSESRKTEPRNVTQLKELIGETIKWHDENKELKPVKLTFVGQVVDTANKAIEGARVNFTKLENYKDEKGYGRQRTVEIGTESTDRSGKFTFGNLPKGRAVTYDLNVSAEGFVGRNKLAISRLPDGRYRWLQNNVIVMQRPSRVRGKVIGPRGQPLANAELCLSINNHYSWSRESKERKLKTDSQGNFIFENVTCGQHLLSFTKYKMVKLPTHGQRREYGGRCAAIVFSVKEGEELENVVLDISKSVCSMEVEIVDSSDQPVGNVSLSFEIETPNGPERAYVYSRIFSTKHSNPQGLYKFGGLPSGKFYISVYNRELGTAERVEVNLVPGKITHCKIKFKDKILPKVKPDVQVEGETDSLDQLGDAPEEVRAIGKVLKEWFESCAAGDLEKVKKAYLPSKSNNAKHDLQRMKQLLEVAPDWQFSLLAVIWDAHKAKAVSHKISHPGADSPLVFVWQLKKFEGQWGIADQFGGGQLNEFGNLEEFLNYLDRYVFCQEYPTGYMWLDTADPNLRLRTNSRKSEAGPFAKSHWPQLDGAPEQVQQIAKVLKKWFAACLAEDAEQIKELYRPNTQRHAEDKLKEMNRILAMAPGWWFSPMMIKFSKSEADAISHPMEKINFPGASDPMISIVRFKKVEGQWTILSSSMGGLRSLPDSYAYFYRRYPDGQIWFDKSIPDWLKPDQQTGVDVDIEELKGISEKVKPDYSLAEKVRAITGDKEIFESYFTDSNEGGKALDQWWPVRDKDPDIDKKIFSMVRNGLRRDSQGKERKYRNKYIKWIGQKYIWGQKPQNKEAIELLYYATFDPELAYDAVYYGLSVVSGKKNDKILKRFVELCMANVSVSRILWGTKGQHEDMLRSLEPYLKSGDLQIKDRASVLGKIFKGEINYSQWAKEQRRQKRQAEFGEKLPEIREVLLRGSSHQRRELFDLIKRNDIHILFDESFVEPLKACLKDGAPSVREAAIEYGGDLFGKRGECSDEMLEIMDSLSKDWDHEVRKAVAVFVGSHWIWGVESQNPKAIEIMMELSKDRDHEVCHNAVYYGLSVVENKSDKVIKRLIEMVLEGAQKDRRHRIGWGLGIGADKEKIKMYLMPYLEPGNRKGERASARQLYREMFKAEPPNSPKEEIKEDKLAVKPSALQSLIDSARAGDTVIVPEGVYTEPIEITKSLTLKGQSRAACVFEVTADRPAIFVDTKGKGRVTIEAVTIKWQLATSDRHEHPFAVAIKDTKAEVKNCNFVPLGNFQRSPVAIRAMGFSNLTINTCRFEGFEYTVCYGEGTEGTIQDSLVMGSGHQGISLYSGATVKIIRNVVTGSEYHGVRSTGGTLDMKDNLIIENANRGVYLGNKSAHGTITNNIITGNRLVGISGFAQSDVKIYNNLILDSGRVGIGAQASCRFLVKDNIIKGNPSGIVVFLKEGARRGNLLIRRNTFWNNETDTENCEKAPQSISEEPAFRDPANGDFSLTGGKVMEQKQGLTDPKVFKALWKRWKNRADKTDVQVEGEPTVSKLLTALQKNEKYVHICEPIIEMVEEIGDKEPISFLVEQLQSENRRRRCDAALALELLGDRRGVPAIIKELEDTTYRPIQDTSIRSDSPENLKRKFEKRQIRQDRYYSALLLGILGDERAVPALIEATWDETINYQAAISLGEIGDKRAVPTLRAMLERLNKPSQRLWAGYGLAMLSDEEGLKVVIDTLNNREQQWVIRRHAIEALGKLGDKQAVPHLIAALKDDHPNIRVSAARALGAIGDASALPALEEALKDKTETKVNAPTTVSKAAAEAIAQIKAGGGQKPDVQVED